MSGDNAAENEFELMAAAHDNDSEGAKRRSNLIDDEIKVSGCLVMVPTFPSAGDLIVVVLRQKEYVRRKDARNREVRGKLQTAIILFGYLLTSLHIYSNVAWASRVWQAAGLGSYLWH
jgi:hypothetical protein